MAENCLFCKIVKGEIPSRKVYEDDKVLAFHDINPAAPVHVVIIPKQHIPGVNDVGPAEEPDLGRVFSAAAKIARDLGVAQSGFRVTANTGPDAGQLVPHVHFHLMGGRGFGWPPG